MSRFTKLFFLGILMISIKNVDFTNASFMLHGYTMERQENFFLVAFIMLNVLATIMLPLRKCMQLFFCLSIYFMINYIVWFTIGNSVVPGNNLLLKDSVPFIYQCFYYHIHNWNMYVFLDDFSAFIVAFIFCIVIMAITLFIKKLYLKVMIYIKKING